MKYKLALFGSSGLVGSNILKKIDTDKYEVLSPIRKDLDLLDEKKVLDWFLKNRVDYVILAAARVGGIVANATYPTEYLYENLTIQNNVIMSAFKSGVDNLVFLGSSCIYPRECQQPIKEEYLLTGPLEKTNKSYALAKIAGIQLCDSIREQYGKKYYSLMPCNLYGPGDNFNHEASHVIPGMMIKIDRAKEAGSEELNLLGTGRPFREFLFIEDLADGVIFVMENHKGEDGIINLGSGEEVTIKQLAEILVKEMDYEGKIIFNTNGPDGTPRKVLDNSKINSIGWKSKIKLEDGIKRTVKWFYENKESIRI
jgi:GDP-L-fucose synthase